MYGLILEVMNIGKTLIPCAQILGIVHAQNMGDHPVDDLNLSIDLAVEGHGFGEPGVHP
jgi:hypothetical protein